jgi:hypothetical protein
MNKELEVATVCANRETILSGTPVCLDAEVRDHNTNAKQSITPNTANSPENTAGTSDVTPEDAKSLRGVRAEIAKMAARNADNDGLGTTDLYGLPGIIEGYVVEVNGELAEEIPDFVPTRDELFQLAKYWTKVERDIEFFHFRFRMTGGSEVRRATFARRRLARIESLVGKDLVEMAKEEAYAEVGKEQDPREWDIFLNGTEEERNNLQAKIARDMQANNAERSESTRRNGEDVA